MVRFFLGERQEAPGEECPRSLKTQGHPTNPRRGWHAQEGSHPMQNQFPIFDGHNDTLLNLYLPQRGAGRSFFAQSTTGHIDLPRAQAGGFGGGFFAVFVPADPHLDEDSTDPAVLARAIRPIEADYALGFALGLTASLYRLERQSAGQLAVVRTAEELKHCLEQGVLAAVLHLEGSEPLDPDLEALEVFYQAGLRSLGIVWSRPNAFGHGVPFDFPASPNSGPGLTEAGKRLVRACNRLGVMIDLSHLNEKGFWDVAELSDAPLVATHSNAHALCPASRNLTDRQLDAIGASGGVVGVNFHVSFLRADGQKNPDTPLTDIVRHIDYIAGRIGVGHVALGSDFDGATMPAELGDVAGLPRLLAVLRTHGYDEDTLRKITHQNWVRVLEQTWR